MIGIGSEAHSSKHHCRSLSPSGENRYSAIGQKAPIDRILQMKPWSIRKLKMRSFVKKQEKKLSNQSNRSLPLSSEHIEKIGSKIMF